MSLKEKLTVKGERKETKKFFVRSTFIFIGVWLLLGRVSFLELPGLLRPLVDVICGLLPCMILICAVAATVERTRKYVGNLSQQLSEHLILVAVLAIALVAELLNLVKQGVSYGLPVTVAGLCLYLLVLMTEPHTAGAEKKYTLNETMKIILLGTFACIVLGKFSAYAVEILSAF